MSANAETRQPAACCGGAAVHLQNKVRDPLCGASVAMDSPYRMEHKGRSHRFCSETCRDDYARAMQGEVVDGVAHECPMHPEMRQESPGDCAVCGMALAPVRTRHVGDSQRGPATGLLRRLRTALRL